jgi:nucleotide-binding universal stress UspA family protein
MKKILVPTDFSNEANVALNFAIELALKNNMGLKLVHVYEYPMSSAYTSLDIGGPNPMESEFVLKSMDKNKALLEETADLLRDRGIQVEHELKVGNPFINISKIIDDEGIDLVIMGSKGSSGIEEFLVGSNTEKMVRHAKCPVLTIKRELKISDVKTIVFASNFKEVDEELINRLKQLQEFFSAKILFVRINTLNDFEPDNFAKKRMRQWLENQMFEDYEMRIYNDIDEEEGIVHYAEEVDADLLAMGTHGRTGFAHLFSGSIAEDLVNHAKRPIWTYHIS